MSAMTTITTDQTSFEMDSRPIHIAMALRAEARRMAGTVPATACSQRIEEVSEVVHGLLRDAIRLVGDDQHDREIRREIRKLDTWACEAREYEGR